MPRYLFRVHDTRDLPDRERSVLAGAEDACAQAVTLAGELLKDLDGGFWTGADWLLDVADEAGATVCTLRFSGMRQQSRACGRGSVLGSGLIARP